VCRQFASRQAGGFDSSNGVISIIPRGVAALGYTEQLPTEDRYLLTRADLLDRLDVLLGGRVAEAIICGDVSTGAANDLQRATDIARHMVAQYSMSDKLGLATFEEPRQAFLAASAPAPRECHARTDLPPTLREHRFDRVADRQISAEDLYKLKLWRESEPVAPGENRLQEGNRCKDVVLVSPIFFVKLHIDSIR
jgi:peptidase M41-like protein